MIPETNVYQVTFLLELERNPRKWIADTITDVLDSHEELLEWDIKQIVSE